MSPTISVIVSTNRVTKQRQSLEMSDENCLSNPRIKGNWLKKQKKQNPTPYLSPQKFVLGSAESKITYYWTVPLCSGQLICWT